MHGGQKTGRPGVGGVNHDGKGFQRRGDNEHQLNAGKNNGSNGKIPGNGILKSTVIPDREPYYYEENGNQTTLWVTKHQSQCVDESVDNVKALRLSGSSEGSSRPLSVENGGRIKPYRSRTLTTEKGVNWESHWYA